MTKKLSLLLSVLILSFGFGYFIFAWTEPGSTPPGGNVSAPLNVGPTTQTKAGGLNLGGNLIVNGNVGIGITTPTEKLHVWNTLRVGNTQIYDNEINRYNNDALYLGLRNTASVQSVANFYAPIMYDRNDSGYYVNPNSNSDMYRIYARADMRSPIYYDRNNTGYYVDPASTSNLNNLRIAGTLRLGWQRIQQACMSRMCKATCSSGYIVVGGGCEMHGGQSQDDRPEYIGYPYWDRRWVCYGESDASEDLVETTYAICLKIQQP